MFPPKYLRKSSRQNIMKDAQQPDEASMTVNNLHRRQDEVVVERRPRVNHQLWREDSRCHNIWREDGWSTGKPLSLRWVAVHAICHLPTTCSIGICTDALAFVPTRWHSLFRTLAYSSHTHDPPLPCRTKRHYLLLSTQSHYQVVLSYLIIVSP